MWPLTFGRLFLVVTRRKGHPQPCICFLSCQSPHRRRPAWSSCILEPVTRPECAMLLLAQSDSYPHLCGQKWDMNQVDRTRKSSPKPWPSVWLSWLDRRPILKGCRFDSWSGHVPRLWVLSPVGVHRRATNQCDISHVDVSLRLSTSFPLSLKSVSVRIERERKFPDLNRLQCGLPQAQRVSLLPPLL